MSKICSDMSQLDVGFRRQLEGLLAWMRERGWAPLVFETWRSAERQAHLWCIGRRGRRGERPVTWVGQSRHQVGLAADVIEVGKWWSNPNFFDALAKGVRQFGLRTFPHDRCHVELVWRLPVEKAVDK